MTRRPHARVVASDLDPRAVACARANGVDARQGDLFAPLPDEPVDVITAVVPYVPTRALPLLQRDTFTFETPLAYDGGEEGLDLLRRVLAEAPKRLKPGGTLVLELGGAQAGDLDEEIARLPYSGLTEIVDEYGDLRGLEAQRASVTERYFGAVASEASSKSSRTASKYELQSLQRHWAVMIWPPH